MIRELSHQARDGLRVVRKAVRQQFIKMLSRDGKLPISPAAAINALGELPLRKRGALLRKITSARSESVRPATAEQCEFNSLGEYPERHAELAALLDRPNSTPPFDELEFLESIITRPS